MKEVSDNIDNMLEKEQEPMYNLEIPAGDVAPAEEDGGPWEDICWYVSTVFGISDDKEWLLREIAELGCIPTFEEFRKGLFKEIKL